jgi:hypothetical protein
VTSVDDRWSARWAAVLAHYQRRGRWPSRRQAEPEVAPLARWIAEQRARHKRGVLDPGREQIMRAAGFDFIPRKTTYSREYPAELIE